mmetsp:Transcript_109429/g.320312  ORF Transcript_109429/g.320312 Transcript_109429/m.320312 type:complete len:242 (-) Transcript_109429:31-756(-)
MELINDDDAQAVREDAERLVGLRGGVPRDPGHPQAGRQDGHRRGAPLRDQLPDRDVADAGALDQGRHGVGGEQGPPHADLGVRAGLQQRLGEVDGHVRLVGRVHEVQDLRHHDGGNHDIPRWARKLQGKLILDLIDTYQVLKVLNRHLESSVCWYDQVRLGARSVRNHVHCHGTRDPQTCERLQRHGVKIGERERYGLQHTLVSQPICSPGIHGQDCWQKSSQEYTGRGHCAADLQGGLLE